MVADAVMRVFIDHGDRTNRAKARLKYVLDAWGFDKFLAAMEEKLGRKLVRVPAEAIAPRPAFDRLAHIGAHPQKQKGLCWIGVVLPVGKVTADQMRGLARIANEFGDGDIRLTVWQNLLISGVAADRVEAAEAAIDAIGLSTKATSIRAGLVACTGNAGCRLAMSNTKRHAEDIAQLCESRVQLDGPINIHLTGCPNSCAQHYIGDIGLLGVKIQVSEEGDQVEGYHIHVGGGFGPDAICGRELFHDVKAEDAPKAVERMLKAYLAHRTSPQEGFLAFARRNEIGAEGAVRAASARITVASVGAPQSCEWRWRTAARFRGRACLRRTFSSASPPAKFAPANARGALPMSTRIELTLACGDYEIMRALKEGTVKPDGIDLKVVTAMDSPTRHWRFLRGHEFDVGEVSSSSYIAARDNGHPFRAIPVFPIAAFATALRSSIPARASSLRRT